MDGSAWKSTVRAQPPPSSLFPLLHLPLPHYPSIVYCSPVFVSRARPSILSSSVLVLLSFFRVDVDVTSEESQEGGRRCRPPHGPQGQRPRPFSHPPYPSYSPAALPAPLTLLPFHPLLSLSCTRAVTCTVSMRMVRVAGWPAGLR